MIRMPYLGKTFFLYYVVSKAKSKNVRVKDCENKRIIMKVTKKM